MYGNIFSGIVTFFITSCIVSSIIGFALGFVIFSENFVERKHALVPDTIIETHYLNGKIKSDTTYIYHLK